MKERPVTLAQWKTTEIPSKALLDKKNGEKAEELNSIREKEIIKEKLMKKYKAIVRNNK